MHFLSHAGPDKPIMRSLGIQLQMVGAEVFFDEWSIGAGESITGAIETAMEKYEVFLVAWSAHSAASLWTRREYRAAVKAFVEDPNRRLIVIRLDDTAVPGLVNDLKWIDLRDPTAIGDAVDQIMGFPGHAARTRAIQTFLNEGGLDVLSHPALGPIVGCPKCGAGLDKIEAWTETDFERDDQYAGVRCQACGCQDGNEI